MPYTGVLYGLNIRSCWPLPSAADAAFVFSALDVEERPAARLTARACVEQTGARHAPWFTCRTSADGSVHLSWQRMLAAAIDPTGAHLEVAGLGPDARCAFRNFLLPQLLSFPLLSRGCESLHATTVSTPSGVIGLLGDSGAGKSTLAAALLQAGCRLVADDLLTIWPTDQGPRTFCGPRVLKLMPQAATGLRADSWPSHPLHRFTRKRAYELPAFLHQSEVVQLRALFVVERASRSSQRLVTATPLTGQQALRRLLQHTFNPLVTLPSRLQRQLELYAEIAARLPIRLLRIRHGSSLLPLVVHELLAELALLETGTSKQTERADHVIQRKQRVG
jgi:hypothetical protein